MLSRRATFDDDPVMDILNDCFCALFSSSARLQKAPFTGRQLAGGHAGYRQYLIRETILEKISPGAISACLPSCRPGKTARTTARHSWTVPTQPWEQPGTATTGTRNLEDIRTPAIPDYTSHASCCPASGWPSVWEEYFASESIPGG